MDETLLARLTALPRLGSDDGKRRSCKICGGVAGAFDVVDFHKMCSPEDPYMFGHSGISVYYYRCADCEFLFTDFFDNWTPADYSRFIYNEDYIKVDGEYAEARPRRDAASFLEMLQPYGPLSILDYGGGAGVLAAALRDAGYDAICYDPFSSPARPDRRFDLITCMEVVEHSPDPVGTLRDMVCFLKPDGCMLVGTGVQPDDIEVVRAGWWYVAPRNGHISLQSSASLVAMGRAAGLIAHPSGYLHGFTIAPSAVSADLMARIGRPVLDLRLAAPDAAGVAGPMLFSDPAGWHGIEDGSFRWTASGEIVWRWTPAIGDCDVALRFAATMAITPDFLAQAQLFVNDKAVPFSLRGQSLRETVHLEDDQPVTIRLVTPLPPLANDINRSGDLRRLGLAVRIHKGRAG
jgi:SAM-dependent methyltransferase